MVEAAHAQVVVKRRPESVAEVRRFARLTLDGWGLEDDEPCLVVSELATNAIVHAAATSAAAVDDEVIVRLSRSDNGELWVEVQDGACVAPHVADATPLCEAGRGLFIVEQLARVWGVRPLADDAGKVVFAVLEARPVA